MLSKRLLREGGEEGSDLATGEYKRRHITASVLRGTRNGLSMQEYIPRLEPNIRSVVHEEVDRVIQRILRPSQCSGSRNLQLRFDSKLPSTLFTCNRVVSEGKTPVKIVLYDSVSEKMITSGPLSSIKVNLIVVDGDFHSDDREDWLEEEFNRKIVKNREGRRPLVNGDSTVSLHKGVGYIGDVYFTDNSSWIRSGKFCLGAKAHLSSTEVRIREGISKAFKVKDHRGESYQKHYPPSLDDEVWRLEKIAKDGASHNRLVECGIRTVKDFLRKYVTDQCSLRAELPKISNKAWETITKHATTCKLDKKWYKYKDARGTELLLNSIYEVEGVTFDGQTYHSFDKLKMYQMAVEDLKQHAYKNLKDLIPIDDQSVVSYQMLMSNPESADDFSHPSLFLQSSNILIEQDQLQGKINSAHTTLPLSNCELGWDNSSINVPFGESSLQMQGFSSTWGDPFGMSNYQSGFFDGGHTWASGVNYGVSHQLMDDPSTSSNIQVKSSTWQGNGLSIGPANHDVGVISSNSGFHMPRNRKPKTSWCKILAVVKWRILARQTVAARKWGSFYNYM
ncbi:calmodulin-binding 60 C [Olea europaea subsp. europaea]|uniref:Calmodulin-binding 60 C n=1 Tax=Olea europaea subsp. europaea TaxID=158383 RepID=A0A8S0SCP7_OLEEU|nr:calmodulin-binding 60 C [Olea europaea subsp. europaea]